MSDSQVEQYKPIGHYPNKQMAVVAARAMNRDGRVHGRWAPVQIGGGWKIQRQS